MSTAALWIGWAVIGLSAGLGTFALLVAVPYGVLNVLWRRIRVQKQFIDIAVRYFDEKKAKERSIMGTPE